ncbi:hypothetical protein BGX23_004657 [Mortierella sp. AD031]|nr:hypothetical protein BGX23_004657 [Mortierella sp. AD031]
MARGYPFVPVKRVNVNDPDVDLEYEVQSRCVENGEPAVLEGFHQREGWQADIFTFPFLRAKFGDDEILCRDLHNSDDVSMTIAEYIDTVHGDSLDANTKFPTRSSSSFSRVTSPKPLDPFHTRQPLIYAKDLTCPSTWRDFLMNGGLPPFLAYMRENDLNNLNTKLAAENLMVYIGQAGTWTPAHIDQCGAIGHNIMTWADNDSCSIWFMIKSEDKAKAEALWSSFGQPLDYEGYFAGLDELQCADFPVYVVEQKLGDFVMVPSQCVHQVINLGKATIKVSWNRLTPNCLKAAMTSVLPRYKQIGRPEGYRIKVIIASTLKAWTEKLETQEEDFQMPKDNFCKAFREVLDLYRGIVEEEWVDMQIMGADCEPFVPPKRLKESQHSQPAICDFCRCDIWNRQFQCRECVDDDDAYDLCAPCYSHGRGCEHREESMEFAENFSMNSCRLTYCRALAAWNQSTALSGCLNHEQVDDAWFITIEPSLDKDFSATSLAYKRYQSVDAVKACHICGSKSTVSMNIECSTAGCRLSFCEFCIYKYYNTLWTDIAGKRSDWKCFRCQDRCPCSQDDRRAATGCTPLEAAHPKALWFTRPEDDYRNYGGVGDDLGQSGQGQLGLGEDNWNERPKVAHGSHISRRTKPNPALTNDLSDSDGGFTPRKRSLTPERRPATCKKAMTYSRRELDDDSDDEWSGKPKTVRGSTAKKGKLKPLLTKDLSDTACPNSRKRSLTTGSPPIASKKSRTSQSTSRQSKTSEAFFDTMLRKADEDAIAFAIKAGFNRTLESLKESRLVDGISYKHIFEMDRQFGMLGTEIRLSFRTDFFDKRGHERHKDEARAREEGAGEDQVKQEPIALSAKRTAFSKQRPSVTRGLSRPKDSTRRPSNSGISLKADRHKMEDQAHEDSADEEQAPITPGGRHKEDDQTSEGSADENQDIQAPTAPSTKRIAISKQHPSVTPGPSRTKDSSRRLSSAGLSLKEDQDDESSSLRPTPANRPKRNQASSAIAKSVHKQESFAPGKPVAAPRPKTGGSKKQAGFRSIVVPYIPNHSLGSSSKAESMNDTDEEEDIVVSLSMDMDIKNDAETSNNADTGSNDDDEDEVLDAGVSQVVVPKFESQAEDNKTATDPAGPTSPPSPTSPTTPTGTIQLPLLETEGEKVSKELSTGAQTMDLGGEAAIDDGDSDLMNTVPSTTDVSSGDDDLPEPCDFAGAFEKMNKMTVKGKTSAAKEEGEEEEAPTVEETPASKEKTPAVKEGTFATPTTPVAPRKVLMRRRRGQEGDTARDQETRSEGVLKSKVAKSVESTTMTNDKTTDDDGNISNASPTNSWGTSSFTSTRSTKSTKSISAAKSTKTVSSTTSTNVAVPTSASEQRGPIKLRRSSPSLTTFLEEYLAKTNKMTPLTKAHDQQQPQPDSVAGASSSPLFSSSSLSSPAMSASTASSFNLLDETPGTGNVEVESMPKIVETYSRPRRGVK